MARTVGTKNDRPKILTDEKVVELLRFFIEVEAKAKEQEAWEYGACR